MYSTTNPPGKEFEKLMFIKRISKPQNLKIMAILFIACCFMLSIKQYFRYVSNQYVSDYEIFINFGTSMWKGSEIYGNLIDVKGPAFFEFVALTQIFSFNSYSLFLGIVLCYFVASVFIYKTIRCFIDSKKISVLSTLLVLILYIQSEIYMELNCETTISTACWFIFIYIFIKVIKNQENRLPVKYFTGLGILSAFQFWNKHENCYLIFFSAVGLFLYLLIKNRKQLIEILTKMWIVISSFLGVTVLILLPIFIQGNLNNMLYFYIVNPVSLSSVSIFNIFSQFYKYYGEQPGNILLFFIIFFLVLFSKLSAKEKFLITFSMVTVFIAMFSSASGSGMDNFSANLIFSVFYIFLPISIYSLIKHYIVKSDIVNGISIITLTIILIVIGNNFVAGNWSESVTILKNSVTHYSQHNIGKEYAIPIYKTNKPPHKHICNKYNTNNKLAIDDTGFNKEFEYSNRIAWAFYNNCKITYPNYMSYHYGYSKKSSLPLSNTQLYADMTNSTIRQNYIYDNYDYSLKMVTEPTKISEDSLNSVLTKLEFSYPKDKWKCVEMYTNKKILYVVFQKLLKT
jgi:hypothetical protein